jgi:pimeloyl-ACP methyl ester carboxylesterase
VLSTRFHGDLQAPRLLLQHGVGSSCTYLAEHVAPSLVTAGWCVVVADLRGHGAASPVRDPSHHGLDRLVADVAALAGAVGAVVVGGVSAGGHAAAAAVARRAVDVERVAVALPAWTGRAVPGEGPHAAVAAEVRDHGVAGMLARLRGEPGLTPWLRRVLLRDLPAGDTASVEAALVALDGGLAPTVAELRSLPVPLAVVGWPDDPGHPLPVAQQWVAAAPEATLVTTAIEATTTDQFALGTAMAEALGPPPR